MSENKPTEILASLVTMLPDLETIYKDIHAHRNCRCRRPGRLELLRIT